MQTFLISSIPEETARLLDRQRLGKQRVEAIQILNVLTTPESETAKPGWVNHPAVRMWRGHEKFLLYVYLTAMMAEWERRGYKNTKCEEHYNRLITLVGPNENVKAPDWFSKELFLSHKSNLIRKDPLYYGRLWRGVPKDLEYVWPV